MSCDQQIEAGKNIINLKQCDLHLPDRQVDLNATSDPGYLPELVLTFLLSNSLHLNIGHCAWLMLPLP